MRSGSRAQRHDAASTADAHAAYDPPGLIAMAPQDSRGRGRGGAVLLSTAAPHRSTTFASQREEVGRA